MTPGQSKLRNRRRAERRNARSRLLDAAHQLLEERGWTDITLEEITTAAEVPRTAFYRYFEDREHLLSVMLDEVGFEVGHSGDPWWTSSEDPVADLHTGLRGLTDLFAEHGRLIQAVADTAPHEPGIAERHAKLAENLIAATTARIEKDIAAGRTHLTEPHEVAIALTRMTESYLLASFGKAPFPHLDAVTRAMTDIWTRTLYDTLPRKSSARHST